jgi:Cu-Zn family superoxide dismutase
MKLIGMTLGLACLLAGCRGTGKGMQAGEGGPVRMKATLQSATGHNVKGVVTFEQRPQGVYVEAQVDGLTPGQHGIHLHQNPDCGGGDFAAAGDHFNPTQASHGGPDDEHSHLGDLGNLEADSSGHATYGYLAKRLSLTGADAIQWRTVVVHEKADDYKTQPSGNSGARVACGALVKMP